MKSMKAAAAATSGMTTSQSYKDPSVAMPRVKSP